MTNVGIIGLGAIGRLHFDCWRRSPHVKLTAIASRDPRKRSGEWPRNEFNLGDQQEGRADLSGITAYERAEDLIADPAVHIVDICTATPLHAPLAITALRAGKHVVCEKPMALTIEECAAVEEAAQISGTQFMVAHCLRFWPHYVRAQEILVSGEFGRPRYAQLFRTGAIPRWSEGGWLTDAAQSGGVLDMHIHDIDVALWWFGRPERVIATGVGDGDLPLIMDAQWKYDGFSVQLHSAWDPHGGPFRHGFRLVMERATLAYDLATAPGALHLFQDGTLTEMPMPEVSAHQAELDAFAKCVAEGERFTRFTPSDSRAVVELGLDELRQLKS